MRTFLVPTDFSETSKNAARYAVQLAAQVEDAQLILYNVFENIAAGTDGTPLNIDDDSRKTIMDMALGNLATELKSIADIPIKVVSEPGSNLIENVDRFARHQMADLIVMGITGATRMELIFMGSNAINLVHHSSVPVWVVPPHARFKKIDNIMFLSDFKNVITTTPIKPIQHFLTMFQSAIHVVNVDSEHHIELTDEYKKEKADMENLLNGFEPEFYFIRLFDFMDAVDTFCNDKKIDLILTVPRKHSFLKNLFTTSHTQKLAYHSTIPIVAIPE